MLLILVYSGIGQDLDRVKNLKGEWKFSIGDRPNWANPDYDDSHWEKIYVPEAWETQGFHGYDGYAWYRIKIQLPKLSEKASYYLQLGFIDDVDEVYLNGKLIGRTGNFPPAYSTAYNAKRLYPIPHKLIGHGKELTIAVRIFDEGGEGGIIHGDVGLYIDRESIYTDFDLSGEWKFRTGDCGDVQLSTPEIETWDDIFVPSPWEDQGYKNYDGKACYALEFELNGEFENDKVVLMLGRIDDLDMVYLNGTLIGQSGPFNIKTAEQRSDSYKAIRGYYIPDNILNSSGKNILIVKVLDWWGLGGIWDGSIGLISQENYIKHWRQKKNSL